MTNAINRNGMTFPNGMPASGFLVPVTFTGDPWAFQVWAFPAGGVPRPAAATPKRIVLPGVNPDALAASRKRLIDEATARHADRVRSVQKLLREQLGR